MEFIRSSLLKDHTAATEVKKIDLPVNPLSHLIISLDMYNATDEATLAEILVFINSIKVEHNGVAVCSLMSEELYALDAYLYGRRPVLLGKLATDNLHRCFSLVVPFGRRIFDPEECYPASKKGELTLSLDYTAPATAADNGTVNVECVQLPGATPRRFLKSVTKTVSAPGATGDNDVELPIGNDILAILMRMTTWPGASTHTYGVDGVTVKVDEEEYGYSFARAQCLGGDLIHHYDTQHGAIAAQGIVTPTNCVIIDYDPLKDGSYALQTRGKSRVHMVLNMGVDEATYVTPLELVSV